MDEYRTRDPFEIFKVWLAEAAESEPNDPEAMCLATADARGRPSARMVLLKGIDARGLAFYTNVESRKGGELIANPFAALCFHWKSLRRQIRAEGSIEAVSTGEADAYFASRARVSQIGALASDQSRPLDRRETLEAKVAEIERRYAGQPVPRPDYWSGFRLVPDAIEFWHDRPYRLHDRIRFERTAGGWQAERLYP